jgi:hypothetical protein
MVFFMLPIGAPLACWSVPLSLITALNTAQACAFKFGRSLCFTCDVPSTHGK